MVVFLISGVGRALQALVFQTSQPGWTPGLRSKALQALTAMRRFRIPDNSVRLRSDAPCRCSSVAEQLPGTQQTWFRLPASAPYLPCKHWWRCSGLVSRISQFDSDTRLHSLHALRVGAVLIRLSDLVRFQGRL